MQENTEKVRRREQLEQLVIDWQKEQKPEQLKAIKEQLFHLYRLYHPGESTDSTRLSGLEILLELITNPLETKEQTQLESSLTSYDPARGTSFYYYFHGLISRRLKSKQVNHISLDKPLTNAESTSDFHALVEDTRMTPTVSTIAFYRDEIFRLVIRSLGEMDNSNYQKLVAWVIFFERQPDRRMLAAKMKISQNSFNTVLGRAFNSFQARFKSALQRDLEMDEQDLNNLVQILDRGIDKEITPELLALLPAERRSAALNWLQNPELQIPAEQLEQLSGEVLHSIPELLDKINSKYPNITFRESTPLYRDGISEGADEMDYYHALTTQLGGIKPASVLRSGGEESAVGTNGLLLTLLGQLFPTPEQQRLRRTVERVSMMSDPAREQLAEKLQISLPKLAAVLNRPDSHVELVKLLSKQLQTTVQ